MAARWTSFQQYKVTPWDYNTGTVIGGDDQGAYAVADSCFEGSEKSFGQYGVGVNLPALA